MKILLIQILRLGDAVQACPILGGLKQHFPGCSINVLTSVIGKEIFERQPEVDSVFVLHKQEMVDLLRRPTRENVLSALELLESDIEPILEQKWDWVINFSFCLPSAILAYIAGGAYYSGFRAFKDRQYSSKEKWFSYALSAFANRKYSLFNWVDINRGIIGLPSVVKEPTFLVNSDEVDKATMDLAEAGFQEKKIVGIHPGASGEDKRWPIEKFTELARRLVDIHDCRVIVFGDQSEKEYGFRIGSGVGDRVLDLTGKTSLSQLGAYMSLCSIVVCNDSGPMHLASAVGTPIIGLFFSTHFVETGPYGENHVVVHPDISCFPCKSTARCTDKKCLRYISPGNIEDLIINHGASTKADVASVVHNDNGTVNVNISKFDPWGYIEWVPVNRRAITPDEFIRSSLRMAMIYHLTNCKVSDMTEKNYVKKFFDRFGPPKAPGEAQTTLEGFLEELEEIENIFNQCRELCVKLQGHFLEKDLDVESIKKLGERLQEKEEAITEMEKHGHAGLLLKYVDIQRNNMSTGNYVDLATRSAELYNDAMGLIRSVQRKRSSMITAFFERPASVSSFE